MSLSRFNSHQLVIEGFHMARKEAALDLWVADRLTECDIEFTSQGSSIKEIDTALKDASKRGTGNAGYPEYVSKIVGLVEGDSAKDKRQDLLDVWNGHEDAPSRFCVRSSVKADDEWLHSFYYFNDEIPSEEDFEKAIADYLTFQLDMVSHGRSYLFEEGPDA